MRKDRQKNALNRLEAQFKVGNKNTKDGVQPLSESDRSRIEKEMHILKAKVSITPTLKGVGLHREEQG